MRISQCSFALILILLSAVVARATIGVGLQMQLGNPSSATTNPANTGNFLLDRAQLALSYNNSTRDPNWVSWHLTTADVGTVDRSDFLPDPDLPAGFYAVTTTEYNGVGSVRIDRGHMSPSKDRTVTVADNQVVFYMTNIVPQAADNNQGPWALFEEECRALAGLGNELLILSGPSGFSSATIPSGVAFVPSFVWKVVVVVPNGPGSAISRITSATRVIALKMPNVNGIRTVPWTDYITSAAEIEADTGYQFFREVPAAIADALRVKVDAGATTPAGAPTILTHPASQTVIVGANPTFSVAASGSGLTYSWRKDGDDIAGATGPTLALSNVQPTAAGTYDVLVTNAAGSVLSNPATLTISAPVAPAITTQPTPLTVLAGGTAVFSAAASGVPAPTYQWFKGALLLAGATNATLTLNNVQSGDSAAYSVVATNIAGSATSNGVLLTVTAVAPTITTQPLSQSVSVGGNVTLSVAASGTAPFTYQWRRNGGVLPGATNSTLELVNVQAANAGSYDVLVTNAASSTASALAIISLTPAGATTPAVIAWDFATANPTTSPLPDGISGGTVVQGNNNGTTALITAVSVSSGYTGATGGNNAGAAARIGVLNTAAAGSAYFQFALLPPAGKRLVTSALSFGTRSTGTGPQAFTIHYSFDNFATFTVLTSGTIANNSAWSLKAPAIPSVIGPLNTAVAFRIYGHNGAGSAGVNTANWRIDDLKVTVYTASGDIPPPTLAVSATSPAANAAQVAIASPVSITFNTPAGVAGSWFTLTSAVHGPLTATVSGGPTTFTLTPTLPFAHNDTITTTIAAGLVTDLATGTGSLSSPYTFSFTTVPPTPPAIATQPRGQVVVVGGGATFNVVATGTAPLTYRWKKNGVPLDDVAGRIAGATTATLVLSDLALGDGGNYSVVVDNPANAPVTSSPALLEVSLTPVAPSIVTPPSAQTISAGGTATFSVIANGTTPLSYQWRKDGAPLSNGGGISGATSDTLILTNVVPGQTGNYDVVVSNGTLPNATSAAATLTVNTAAGLSLYYYAGGYYHQNFDTLPSAGSFSFASDGPFGLDAPAAGGGVGAGGMTGWSFVRYGGGSGTASFRVDTGSNSAGGVVSYGSSGATDRALGTLGSGSNESRVGVMIVNRTGAPITQFTVRYLGEQWRHGGATTPNKLTFGYALGAANINSGTFTAAAALDFTAPVTTTTSGALNGNAEGNRSLVIAQVSGISWGVGQVLVLRWTDVNDGGSDDGLALDDFLFTTETLTLPVITTQPISQSVIFGAPVTLTVAASGTPSPTYQWRKNGVNIPGATNATLQFNALVADAGPYTCAVSNLAGTVISATANLAVAKAPATVVLGQLVQTYTGNALAPSVTTNPAGLAVDLVYTYDGVPAVPIEGGTYGVTATINDANYAGTASGAFQIMKAPAGVQLSNLAQTYTGAPRIATATTDPAGLAVVITYDGSTTAPMNAGSYAVLATIQDRNRFGTASGTLVVAKATATIALAGLSQPYDGTPRVVTATTTPAGLTVNVTYNGSASAPIYPGAYNVQAVIDAPNHQGSATATLIVGSTAMVRHAPSVHGVIDGSLQVMLPETFSLNAGALVSGDLLVPGLPTVRQNGKSTLAGIREGTGSATPSNYEVILNQGAVVRYLVRRLDGIALPVVAAPPAPAGTRRVIVNRGQPTEIGDFATLRDLTLNHNGVVVVPAGTYGDFTANGGSGFTLGQAGATAASVYNFERLTLHRDSSLRILGPVIITVASAGSIQGTIGAAANPAWLTLNVASGGVTLTDARVDGTIVAPAGTITLNGDSLVVGRVIADRLTVSGDAELRAVQP